MTRKAKTKKGDNGGGGKEERTSAVGQGGCRALAFAAAVPRVLAGLGAAISLSDARLSGKVHELGRMAPYSARFTFGWAREVGRVGVCLGKG